MHLIEDACEDYSKGIRHAVCEVIDMCWETIKDRHDGETWLGYLCNAVSEESKEELITCMMHRMHIRYYIGQITS